MDSAERPPFADPLLGPAADRLLLGLILAVCVQEHVHIEEVQLLSSSRVSARALLSLRSTSGWLPPSPEKVTIVNGSPPMRAHSLEVATQGVRDDAGQRRATLGGLALGPAQQLVIEADRRAHASAPTTGAS